MDSMQLPTIGITMENILNFRFCRPRNRGGNLLCAAAIGTLSIVLEGLNTLLKNVGNRFLRIFSFSRFLEPLTHKNRKIPKSGEFLRNSVFSGF